ncbi:DnaB-like helicase C-terminal domain-containing protein (plasmid) [Borreliella garinii]|nr:DnaB-like helicase C-terminal domain-containing protein [Borreliella garinii]WNZ74037.1 DnaB-like helicase C-terminal domain-containing protein [Borreliella garinii]WNZ75009.1 DnaB-like helicase C-terminal domain-containing protein [Borreliella garinii]
MRHSILEVIDEISQSVVDKSTDLGALIDNAQSQMNSMELNYKNSSIHIAANIDKAIIDDIKSRNFIENDYIESGFSGLDRIIKGFKKSDFVIVGARPNVGKTAFALNIANNLCQQNISVGFFQ